ncbi:TPA: hypothetical protein N0F65_006132 [Lagenidium giganteum]|uniref:Pentacotripeptide-repeat region of PRORP domain-containing protein n=1 Tax=Lagenidium giganteum TaxID=4803 RepID=A0AAV2Z5A6_9STRA|nr:TPA: hypothetical protein N0F65_006132 [Lagenidium giganteum]
MVLMTTKMAQRMGVMALRRGLQASQRTTTAAHALVASRAYSGNREYPRIEDSVPVLATKLNKIGAMLSIPTAAIYLTNQKLEYLVRHMKDTTELKEVHKVMLLADAKFVYPSTYTIGTYVNACLKQGEAGLALEFVRKADNMRHYIPKQSLVRIMAHYAEQGEQDVVEEITARMAALGIEPSFKVYNFLIANAKKQNKFDDAVALAKKAAADREINAHTLLTLVDGLEGEALQEQIPLIKYLMASGDVYANDKLTQLLASN